MCRLILTAGLCLIITTLASATPTNQFCYGKSNGDYTNPENPNSFITCSNGLASVTECQPGLVFSQSLDRCDWPPNTAPATTTPAPTTTTTSAASTNQFCKDNSNGDYANPENPNSFITCSNGLTYFTNCQSGLIFSESLDRCDWPPTTAPAPTTTATSVASTDLFCYGKSDGDYANVNNPYTFYICSNGLTFLRNCPSGLIFRQSCDCCDWPSTTASTTTRQTAITTKSVGPTRHFCNGKSDGDYSNPKNPNSFYTCSNGLTYIRNCQLGLIFRQSCDCCDWPPTEAPTTTTKTATTTTIAAPIYKFCKGKSNGDYANPKNPNSFYTCLNGLTYIRNCQSGFIFRESCDCCDWPTTAAPTTTTQTAITTKSAGPTRHFCNGKSDGDYSNPKNPNSFYTCSNGLTYLTNCQPGLIFSQSCDCCDWPTTTASTTTTKTTTTNTSAKLCSVFFMVCNSFIFSLYIHYYIHI